MSFTICSLARKVLVTCVSKSVNRWQWPAPADAVASSFPFPHFRFLTSPEPTSCWHLACIPGHGGCRRACSQFSETTTPGTALAETDNTCLPVSVDVLLCLMIPVSMPCHAGSGVEEITQVPELQRQLLLMM